MTEINSKIMGGKIGTFSITSEEVTIDLFGSNDIQDILMAARCFPNNGIHSGVEAVYQECLKPLVDEIRFWHIVKLTGYSAGGMLVQRILYALKNRGCGFIKVALSGSPKVLSEKRVLELKEGLRNTNTVLFCTRIIWGNDWAPILFPGYSHLTDSILSVGNKRRAGAWIFPWNWKDHTRYKT